MEDKVEINFEVGDTVLYEGWDCKAITKVCKITPKGGIRIERDKSILFNSRGHYCSNGDWGRIYTADIRKITPEEEASLRAEWGKKRTITECKKALTAFFESNKSLSYEAAVKILEILKREEAKAVEGETAE